MCLAFFGDYARFDADANFALPIIDGGTGAALEWRLRFRP